MTNYIVCLKKGNTSLEILGTQEAHSADAAIKKQAGEAAGRYVAIPMSNWHEADNAPEQQPPPRPKLTKVEAVFPGQTKIDDVLVDVGDELADDHSKSERVEDEAPAAA